MSSRRAEKERRRQERVAQERRLAAARRRRRRQGFGLGGVLATAVIVAIVVALASSGGGGSGPPPRLSTTSIKALGDLHATPPPGPLGPEGVPIPQAPALASNASAATGQTVDGVQCNTGEQTLFHVHTHLTIFVDGSAHQVPYGIGIAPPRQLQQSAQGPFVAGGSCFYWLHTHAADGIIHIESPVQRTFTLGDFFAIWGQPLGPNQAGPAKGKVTAFYNGALYRGNPRDIPLGRYTQIQLDVGSPLIAPEHISFAGTGL